MATNDKPLPNAYDFYVNASLYDVYSASIVNKKEVFNLVFYTGTIDCYCPKCGDASVFTSVENRPNSNRVVGGYRAMSSYTEWLVSLELSNFVINKRFECVRDSKHLLDFYIQIEGEKLQKIGQFPSIADLNSFGISKFKKTLGHQLFTEFNRGIGLFSHGIGVGSFVYLRRIIENFIIKPAYDEACKHDGWDEAEYQRLRVAEKIKKLKDYLPGFLVENHVLYSIVSKGIHELTEEECKEYFPVLRECMEYVLTEIQARKETEEKRKNLTQRIGQIADKLKS